MLVKSAIPMVFAWTAIPVGGVAQELPTREPLPGVLQGEYSGDLLPVAEPLEKDLIEAADSVSEAVSFVEGGIAGRRGRWRVEPRLLVTGTYDDNIFIRPNNKVADYITTLAPGSAFGFWDSAEARERDLGRLRAATAAVERSRGNFLIFDYSAILMGFARTTSQNSLDHDARFDAQWKSGIITLGASVRYESKAETNNEVGGRLRRKTLSAALTASYKLSEKITLALGFYNTTNHLDSFARTIEWRGEGSVDYDFTSRSRFGFGFAAGKLLVDRSSDQVFERLLVRAGYSLSNKLDVDFRGGIEFRQSDGRAGNRENPIVDLRATWTPVSGTRVGVSAYRRTGTAIESPEEFINTSGVALTFLQAMRGGTYLSIEGGYEVSRYIGETRKDRYFFIRPGLYYKFADWGTAGVSYEYRRNESNRAESSFRNNQITLEIAVKY